MQFRIDGNPDYGELTVALDAGERVRAESGAMSRMSRSLEMTSSMSGGLAQSLIRKVFAGQSLFVGEYHSSVGGWISLAPRFPGTVLQRTLGGDTLHLTAGSFLACSADVVVRPRFGGLRALFSREGLAFLECRGNGELFFAAFGGVVEREVSGSLVVDTGHLVAWEPGLDYKITGFGGFKQTLFSGEGLVMEFSGRGKIWLQTRTLGGLVRWLSPFCIGRG